MGRGRKVVLVLGIFAAILLAGSAWAGRRQILAWYRYQTVKRLLEPTEREAAFRKVLSWQIYDGEPRVRVTEKSFANESIERLVLCPQPTGKPIFAVLFRDKDQDSKSGQHIELIAWDGMIIPFWWGYNFISRAPEDINGDGLVEVVDSMDVELEEEGDRVRMFFVLPVTCQLRPALMVLYDRGNHKVLDRESWNWWPRKTGVPGVCEIALGRESAGEAGAQAVYRWSKERKEYVGPQGGYDLPFVRVTEETLHDALERLRPQRAAQDEAPR